MATGGLQEYSAETVECNLALQKKHREFAADVFKYLLRFAHIDEYPTDYRTSDENPDVMFSEDIGKAVIALGYMLRIAFRKKFKMISYLLGNIENFKCYITAYTVERGANYFHRFLAWIAFMFDLTMYLCKEGLGGKEYIEVAQQCLANYCDMSYFYEEGGWAELYEVAKPISRSYHKLAIVINEELPHDKEIVPFLKSVEKIEKGKTRLGDKSELQTPQFRYVKKLSVKLSDKYDVIPTSDPKSVTAGYQVKKKVSLKNVSPMESPKEKPHNVVKDPVFKATEDAAITMGEDMISWVRTHMAKISISEKAAESAPLRREKEAVNIQCSSTTLTDSEVKEFLEHPETTLPEQSKSVPSESTGAIPKGKLYAHQTQEVRTTGISEDLTGETNSKTGSIGKTDVQVTTAEVLTPAPCVDLTKVAFFMKVGFLGKRIAAIAEAAKMKSEAIWTLKNAFGFDSRALAKQMDKLIENKNYTEISKDIYSVNPPNFNLAANGSKIMLMDKSIVQTVSKHIKTVVRKYESTTLTESQAKEELIERHEHAQPEQSESVPGGSTGAIPEVKLPVQQADEASATGIAENVSGETPQKKDPNDNTDKQGNTAQKSKKKGKGRKRSKK